MESIRSQLTSSIKEKNEIKKGILRVVLGDLSTLVSRSGKTPTDKDIEGVVKKLLEGNNETLKYINASPKNTPLCSLEAAGAKLTAENAILLSLLPKTLSRDEIKNHLNFSSDTIIFEIEGAKSDGQATGIAAKWFSAKNLLANGSDVAAVVKELRAEKVIKQ